LVALQAGRLGSLIEVVNKFGSYLYGRCSASSSLPSVTETWPIGRRSLRRAACRNGSGSGSCQYDKDQFSLV
jgi:hypothetical protein